MRTKTRKPLVTGPNGFKHTAGTKEATVMEYRTLMAKGQDSKWNILRRLAKRLDVSSSTIWNWVRLHTSKTEGTTVPVTMHTSHTLVESINIRTIDGDRVRLTLEDIERISKLAGTSC